MLPKQEVVRGVVIDNQLELDGNILHQSKPANTYKSGEQPVT